MWCDSYLLIHYISTVMIHGISYKFKRSKEKMGKQKGQLPYEKLTIHSVFYVYNCFFLYLMLIKNIGYLIYHEFSMGSFEFIKRSIDINLCGLLATWYIYTSNYSCLCKNRVKSHIWFKLQNMDRKKNVSGQRIKMIILMITNQNKN